MRDLPADQVRADAPDQRPEQREREVLFRDDFVIRRENIAAPKTFTPGMGICWSHRFTSLAAEFFNHEEHEAREVRRKDFNFLAFLRDLRVLRGDAYSFACAHRAASFSLSQA
jgi:hypothetical protein